MYIGGGASLHTGLTIYLNLAYNSPLQNEAYYLACL